MVCDNIDLNAFYGEVKSLLNVEEKEDDDVVIFKNKIDHSIT